MLDRHQSVANLVLDHSECAEVLARHHIDFCCRGGLSIEAAAAAKRVDPDALLGELSRVIEQRLGDRTSDLRKLSTPGLIDHIVSIHHEYTRTALPFIGTLADRVSRVHGEHNPKLRVLASAVDELSTTLISHLEQEEQALFPALLAASGDSALIAEQLAAMVEEHSAIGYFLEWIREVSDDFRVPGWACQSYRTLFAELEHLEHDVHTHVHIENHVLAPRFGIEVPAR
ncbi:MAG TPA: iron-sulfur cluster repair di-iron protein [Polyangiaceae bacterium]